MINKYDQSHECLSRAKLNIDHTIEYHIAIKIRKQLFLQVVESLSKYSKSQKLLTVEQCNIRVEEECVGKEVIAYVCVSIHVYI